MSTINHHQLVQSNLRWEKYKNEKRPIPRVFSQKLHRLGFFDTNDPQIRLHLAVRILATYRLSTAIRYFNVLKYGAYFGDVEKTKHLVIRKETFREKTPQIRLPDPKLFRAFVSFLQNEFHRNITEYASTNILREQNYMRALIAIVFCWNTGLRVATILSLTNKHLRQLLDRSVEIEIKNKTQNSWIVVYHTHLLLLIDIMATYFQSYMNLDLEVRLFPFGQTYLLTVVRNVYISANNELPPTGFGLHSIRYYIATEFAKANIKDAQELLGHKNIKTTKAYVRHTHTQFADRIKAVELVSEQFTKINALFRAQ